MHVINRLAPLAMLGMLAATPAPAAGFGEVSVVTHIDLIPNSAGVAPPEAVKLLKQFVTDSRKDPGVESFQLITWSPTTNHFQLLELFRDRRSFEAHASAKHTVDFRNNLQQYIGAPYDERLYRPVF
ncbi:MAG TPA: antibiotic biosynthesis monooxygenase [Stellaceae bacterium]|jgi:quinol monooxygenase YgiN